MFKKLGAWIASIVRKELAEIAVAFGKDFEEQAKRAEADLAAIKAHVAQELANAKHELIGFTSTAALNLRGDAAKHTAALTEHAGKEGELARAAILDLRHFIAQEMAASSASSFRTMLAIHSPSFLNMMVSYFILRDSEGCTFL